MNAQHCVHTYLSQIIFWIKHITVNIKENIVGSYNSGSLQVIYIYIYIYNYAFLADY